MSVSLQEPEIDYPETDGQPMGDNTLQIKWMIVLFSNLESYLKDDPQVFTACNLMWYPVKGNNKIVTAPDVMVAYGRPKGHRPSYKQWEENNVPPTVGIEILSPQNTAAEMRAKLEFNECHGMEEYYVYDPYDIVMEGYRRSGKKLVPIREMNGWVSPRLKVRFDLSGDELVVWKPDGECFLTFTEVQQASREAYQRNEELKRLADQQRQEADKQRQEADKQRQEADKQRLLAERETSIRLALLEKLKARGIDPDQL